MKFNSLYVTAKNFNRARTWYIDILFQRKAEMETDRFVFWDLSGVYFGVFNPKVTNGNITYGNNCIPNIEVNNLDRLYDRLQMEGVEIIMSPHVVNDTKIF